MSSETLVASCVSSSVRAGEATTRKNPRHTVQGGRGGLNRLGALLAVVKIGFPGYAASGSCAGRQASTA